MGGIFWHELHASICKCPKNKTQEEYKLASCGDEFYNLIHIHIHIHVPLPNNHITDPSKEGIKHDHINNVEASSSKFIKQGLFLSDKDRVIVGGVTVESLEEFVAKTAELILFLFAHALKSWGWA